MKLLIPVVLLTIALFTACTSPRFVPATLQYASLEMDPKKTGESEALKIMLKPYGDSVDKTMNITLGSLQEEMTKSWPECSLGAFMTDAYLKIATEKFNQKVDFALMNYGGIRLGSLPAGPVTRGKIFELMPFDNVLVLLKMTGNQVQDLLNDISSKGGWPIAGGRYTIADKKAINILIGGKPLEPEKIYVLATSDYIANGGDESSVLKNIPQTTIGYLQREALIAYVKSYEAQNKSVPYVDSKDRVIQMENIK